MARLTYQEVQTWGTYRAYADCDIGAVAARKYWINYDKGAYGSGSNTSTEKTYGVNKTLLGGRFSCPPPTAGTGM